MSIHQNITIIDIICQIIDRYNFEQNVRLNSSKFINHKKNTHPNTFIKNVVENNYAYATHMQHF